MEKKQKMRKGNWISPEVEMLYFLKEDQEASIATSGERHVTQCGSIVKEHQTLRQAICYLEAKKFCIDTSKSIGL